MAGKVNRRSGNSVVEFLTVLDWEPKSVYMVGVGLHHEEVDVMRETWGREFCLYAFEPNPSLYKEVSKTFPGRIRDFAISNYQGVGCLHSKDRWRDGSSLFPKSVNPEQYQEILVEVTTLDHLRCIMPADPPGLLWLDCEGSELHALEGGEEFIEERIQVINIEQTGRPRGDDWPSPFETHRWLREHGFLQAWTHTNRICIGQFDSIYVKAEIFDPSMCSCLESIDALERMTVGSA